MDVLYLCDALPDVSPALCRSAHGWGDPNAPGADPTKNPPPVSRPPGSGAWSQDSGSLAPQSSAPSSVWGGAAQGAGSIPAPPTGPPQIMRRGGGGVKPDEFPTLGSAVSGGPAAPAGADGGRASWDADERAPQGVYPAVASNTSWVHGRCLSTAPSIRMAITLLGLVSNLCVTQHSGKRQVGGRLAA